MLIGRSMTNLAHWLAVKPLRRAVTQVTLTVGITLLAGALMVELASGNIINWNKALGSIYAWVIFILYCLYAWFQTAVYKIDMKTAQIIGKNNPYRYVQKKCLDQYAEQCKKLIAEGKLEEYHEAQDRLPGKEN